MGVEAPHVGRKVLVIDDSEICRDVETAVLQDAGFDVRTAENIAEFDRILESWRPEIILTDLQMPDIDGATLCKMLRTRMKWSRVPIVMFSSVAESELEKIASDAFLCKRGGFGDLPERLAQLCEEIIF